MTDDSTPDIPPAPASPPPQPPSGAPTPPPAPIPPYAAPPAPPYGAQPYGAQPAPPYGAQPAPPYGAPPAPPYGAQPAPPSGAQPAPPYGSPYAAYGAPPSAPGPRPGMALAITAIVLAGVGFVFALIPVVTGLSWLFLIAAIVVAIVALVRRAEGRGLSIAAIVVAVAGGIASIVVLVVSVFAAVGSFISSPPALGPTDLYEPPAESITVDIETTETAFGRLPGDDDYWWYVAVLEVPQSDVAYEYAFLDVEARTADGDVLDAGSTPRTLLPGTTVVTGYFEAADEEIDGIEVIDPVVEEYDEAPIEEYGPLVVGELTDVSDEYSTAVEGVVTTEGTADIELAEVIVLARDADGAIFEVTTAYPDAAVTAEEGAPFEALFTEVHPEGTTYEAYAAAF